MAFSRWAGLAFLAVALGGGTGLGQEPAPAREPAVQTLVDEATAAVGGKEKLLRLFEMKERLVLGAKQPPEVTAETKPSRISVVEAPKYWWIGGKERGAEPAKLLVHAWSLGVLHDPAAKLELLPDAKLGDASCRLLKVSGVAPEPLELFFNAETHRLVAIDWRSDRHLFDAWKTTTGGLAYPSRTIGYKFSDRKTKTLAASPWYQTDILSITPLTDLPAGLSR
jgi:hypothetical protein